MTPLASTDLKQHAYDVDFCEFHSSRESTGPRVTPLQECWPGTSDQIIVVRSERRWSAEDPLEIGEVDMTGADFRSAHTAWKVARNLTSVEARDDLTAVLHEIIAAQAPRIFVALVEAIDWSTREPDELTAAIDLALQEEMPSLAMRLARLGARVFPHHERIQRAARVLAPPLARSTQLPPAEGLEASRKWLREHADEYHGQWVAVREGQLMGAAPTLDELEAVHSEDTVDILFTKVL